MYFFRGKGILEKRRRWGCKIDQEMFAVQGSPCVPNILTLINHGKLIKVVWACLPKTVSFVIELCNYGGSELSQGLAFGIACFVLVGTVF